MNTSASCDLCGLPILGRPVRKGDRDFCCEGCQRVFATAEQAGIALGVTALDRRQRVASSTARKAAAAAAVGARRDTFRIQGMWCASCALVLEDALMQLPGVLDAELSYAASLARVTRDPNMATESDVLGRIEMLGYSGVHAREAPGAAGADSNELFLRFFVAAAVGMWVSWPTWLVIWPGAARAGWGGEHMLELFTGGLTLVVLLFSGWPFLAGAWRAARVGRATMDTLVALGTWTAWIYSLAATFLGGPTYFDSAVMITGIVLLGRWLEALGTRDVTGALAALVRADATTAWLADGTDNSNVHQVGVTEVAGGDVVLVRPGERIPVDGIVLAGESEVERSHLTGEPMPSLSSPGDEVWAGTLNLSGILTVRVSRAGQDTLSGRLASLVEDAAFAKSHSQRLADAISAVFVPFVLSLSALTALATFVSGSGVAESVSRAIAVLVVACPCALGLATPLAVSNAVASAARSGVVFRGGPALERMGDLVTVAFDKTGTLTLGTPGFAGFLGDPSSAARQRSLVGLAASLESGEAHPVARAIRAAAAAEGLEIRAATALEHTPGAGLSGRVDGALVLLGSERLLAHHGLRVPVDLAREAAFVRAAGDLVVWLVVDGTVAAMRFVDEIRPEASASITDLHAQGLHIAMVSGDATTTSRAIADRLGITRVHSEVLPHEKESVLQALAQAGPVAFVGDGINDAAALAAADLSIALEDGADVAVMASDAVLLAGPGAAPLAGLSRVLRIARSARRVIRENLGWAFTYNLVALPLAVTGYLTPIWAAAAMAASSLAVVANSLRLRAIR